MDQVKIGSFLKELRKEKNLTQEQLAEYLGISACAISQWECDRTSPDISQIPALCHIFDITSDTLLGIDIEKTNEQIVKYLNDAKSALYEGKFEDNLEIPLNILDIELVGSNASYNYTDKSDVDVHIITATTTTVQNIFTCASRAGYTVDGVMLKTLATAQAVLTEEEKEILPQEMDEEYYDEVKGLSEKELIELGQSIGTAKAEKIYIFSVCCFVMDNRRMYIL